MGDADLKSVAQVTLELNRLTPEIGLKNLTLVTDLQGDMLAIIHLKLTASDTKVIIGA